MMAFRTVLILRCLAQRGLEGRKGVDPAYLTILAQPLRVPQYHSHSGAMLRSPLTAQTRAREQFWLFLAAAIPYRAFPEISFERMPSYADFVLDTGV